MTSGLFLALAVLGGFAAAPFALLVGYFIWLLTFTTIRDRIQHRPQTAATRQTLDQLNAEYRHLCEGAQQ